MTQGELCASAEGLGVYGDCLVVAFGEDIGQGFGHLFDAQVAPSAHVGAEHDHVGALDRTGLDGDLLGRHADHVHAVRDGVNLLDQ